ncbi:MAG: hypothetical protein ACI8Z1_000987, partial [Candidatus Azotimanducaceae bacterium]
RSQRRLSYCSKWCFLIIIITVTVTVPVFVIVNEALPGMNAGDGRPQAVSVQ